MSDLESPKCESIVLCDYALQDKRGKYSLIGIFDKYTLQSVPSPRLPPFFIYVVVKDLRAMNYKFALNIVHEESTQVILPINGELNQTVPGVGQLLVPVGGIQYFSPGAHLLSVHLNGGFAGSKVIDVVTREHANG